MTKPSVEVARPPQQGRSRASFERMLNAAEALLVEWGNDGFALTDVSRVGKVSIGSIYNRFSSKDELIHAVHARLMDQIAAQQQQIVMRARSRSQSPASMVRSLMDELGEFLSAHAPMLRPIMLRAAFDSVVQNRGRSTHQLMADTIAGEILHYRALIAHPDPERAVHSAIRLAYAAFARELGFGMAESPQGAAEWQELKADIGEMAVRFLFCTLENNPANKYN